MTFSPCGVITLTSDFGHRGPFVGVMKGQILVRFPAARIIDFTHEIHAHWPVEAGFWLARSYRYFPEGSVHVAVVDPGVGSSRSIVALEADGHLFLAPDNGLLAPLQAQVRLAKGDASEVEARAFRLDSTFLHGLRLPRPSATFHGRDIFAPVAAELAAGRHAPESLGPLIEELVPSWVEEPAESRDQVSGIVITLDNFGNLITNIESRRVQRFRQPVVRTGNQEFLLRRTYSDAKPGDYLALVNSFDVVEIARVEQSAAEGLGVGRGAPVLVSDKIP